MLKNKTIPVLLALCIAVLSATSYAQNPLQPIVDHTNIDYSVTPNRMTVTGSNFSTSGAAPTVVLNGVTLTLMSFTDTSIVAHGKNR